MNRRNHHYFFLTWLLAPALLVTACATRLPQPAPERMPAPTAARGAPAVVAPPVTALPVIIPSQPAAGGDVIATPIKPGAAAPQARALPGAVNQPANAGTGNAVLAQSELLKSAPKAIKLPYSPDALALVQNPGLEGGTAIAAAKPGAEVPVAANSPTVVAPPSAVADGVTDWAWPAQGKIKGFFSEANKGLDITGALGQPVMASAAGKVIYVGSSVPHMGKMVVISHSKNYLSLYAHNDKILVKEDQQVSKGQKIAEMGNTDSDHVKLHFEIRLMGKPVDPMKYLPGDKIS